jgi:hypothetical protein
LGQGFPLVLKDTLAQRRVLLQEISHGIVRLGRDAGGQGFG